MKMKKKDKKAAIQLSMSFLVMLIIAIVVFMLSIRFLTSFWQKTDEIKLALDDQTKVEIERLLKGNARVAIPLETKKADRGESVSYGIGIRNTLPDEFFKISVHNTGLFIPVENQNGDHVLSCSGAECTITGYSGQGYEGEPVILYLVGRGGEAKIEINKQDSIVIGMSSMNDAPRGHYIFNIEVCSGPSEGVVCSASNYYGDSPTPSKINLIVT